ncbi:MAG: nitroreductase family protein [Clostridiaceae bacterium]
MNAILTGLKKRRSRYELKPDIPISDDQLAELIGNIFKTMPSPMNSQSSRAVLLFGEDHLKLWRITLEEMKKTASEAGYAKGLKKVETSFQSGYGTILFYEDGAIVRELEEKYPKYARNFPVWSAQTSGMHQIAVWSALADEGIGASLQHYNELIDERVRMEWNIPDQWKLYAQMPFGRAVDVPKEKDIKPLEERVIIHRG